MQPKRCAFGLAATLLIPCAPSLAGCDSNAGHANKHVPEAGAQGPDATVNDAALGDVTVSGEGDGAPEADGPRPLATISGVTDASTDGAPNVDAGDEGGDATLDAPVSNGQEAADGEEAGDSVIDGPDAEEADGGSVEGVAPGVTAAFLQTISAGCASCANQSGCSDPANGACDGFGDAGPCIDVLRCEMTQRCASPSMVVPCFCGDAGPSECSAGIAAPNGPCVRELSAAVSITDAAAIFNAMQDPTTSAGSASGLVVCLEQSIGFYDGCNTCFP